MELSIIIPCFNEEKIIKETVVKVHSYLVNELKDKVSKFEIITVNDGSSDKTQKIIEGLNIEELNSVNFDHNKGRGAAMKAGIKKASLEYLMFLDADLSYDVDHIGEVAVKFTEDPSIDLIIISPYMKGGVAKNIPFSRLLLSKAANWILSGFFSKKISTVTSMVRAYKRDIICHLPLLLDGKELHLEILKKMTLKNANVLEIPGRLIWKDKVGRAGRLDKKKVADSAFKHLNYAFMARPNRILSKVGIILFIFSIYEFVQLFLRLVSFYTPKDELAYGLWLALSKVFSHSPHSVVLAVVSLFLSIQFFTIYFLYTMMKNQNEEVTSHLIHLIEKTNSENK